MAEINQDLTELIISALSEDEIKREINAPLINMLKFNNRGDNVYGKEEKIKKLGGKWWNYILKQK